MPRRKNRQPNRINKQGIIKWGHIPFLKYGLRTEEGQAKEDNFLYSLPLFIVFLSLSNFPQLYLHSG